MACRGKPWMHFKAVNNVKKNDQMNYTRCYNEKH